MTQDTPPGLERVPVSCYIGSCKTWAFDNELMAEFEDAEIGESGLDDEFVDEGCKVEGTPKTEHFNIDIPLENNTKQYAQQFRRPHLRRDWDPDRDDFVDKCRRHNLDSDGHERYYREEHRHVWHVHSGPCDLC